MTEILDIYAGQPVGMRGRIDKLAQTSLAAAGIMIVESELTAAQHVLQGDFSGYPEVREAYTAIQGLLGLDPNEVY